MDNFRNFYFSDININIISNNVENKLYYSNEYKPAVMPSQPELEPQKIKKEYTYVACIAVVHINEYVVSSMHSFLL